MKLDIWYPFYVGDYHRDTMHLTTEQHGAYRLLLDDYYSKGGPIPDDDGYLSSVTKLMRDAWLTHRPRIAPFFRIEGGVWHHTRADSEINKRSEINTTRSDAASKAAAKRWEGHQKGVASRNASRITDASVKHTQSQPQSHKEKDIPASGVGKAFIEGWCQNYKSHWKIDYLFKGGRDGKSVKELMSLGIIGLDLLEIAKKAWAASPQTFETRQAQTIHGFREYINQLNLFAKNGHKSQASKPNPRNFGIIRGPTNYATAKPKFNRERDAEAERLAGQVAAPPVDPPTTNAG